MHELDGRGAGDRVHMHLVIAVHRRVRRAEGQRRPDPLAPGLDEMAGHLTQERVVLVANSVTERSFDPRQVAGQGRQLERLGNLHA